MPSAQPKWVQPILKNERGASFLVALLFFLVASMIAVVIIAASITTINRIDDDKQREQEYLSVTSAARVVRESMAGSSCSIVVAGTESEDSDGEVSIVWDEEHPAYEASGEFGEILAYMVKKASADVSPTETSPCTVRVTVTPYCAGVPEGKLASCTLTLNMFVPSDNQTYDDAICVINGWIESDGTKQAAYLSNVYFVGSWSEEGLTKRCDLHWNDSTQIKFSTMGG